MFLSAYSGKTLNSGLWVSWSLCVEVTFYLALPLFALGAARLTRGRSVREAMWVQLALIAMLAAGATALRYLNYRYAPSHLVQNSLPSLFYWFALGMALAVISAAFQNRPASPPIVAVARHPGVCWGAALAVYLVIAVMNGRLGVFTPAQEILGYYVLGGVFALLLILPAVLGEHGGGWPRRVMW